MICPECHTSYSDEFLYCLSDGAPLVDDEAETPTVLRSNAEWGPACPSCGLPNKTGSRFCKRCGFQLAVDRIEIPAVSMPATADATPALSIERRPSGVMPFVLIAIGAVILALIAAVVAYNLGAGSVATNANANTNKLNSNASPTRTATATPTPSQTPASVSGALVGKTGTLTTDVNLRDSPDRNSSKVGTHYQGARVKILETAEAPNDEGTMSTWYRIQVQSYGTSVDPNNYGLDKDPGSADEGWINSNPKVWDPAKKAQVHKRTVNFDEP